MNTALRLDAQVRLVCPIFGVSVSTKTKPNTVVIDFDPAATKQQMADAQAVVDAFDWSDAAQQAYEEQQKKATAKAALFAPTDPQLLALWAAVKDLYDRVGGVKSDALVQQLQATIEAGISVPE